MHLLKSTWLSLLKINSAMITTLRKDNEMILASAIKFRISATGSEVVLCGARHGDIWPQLDALGFDPKDGYEELEQGFIDHHNNFLTRKEAFAHAKECGQLCARIAHERESGELCGGLNLISEDLW